MKKLIILLFALLLYNDLSAQCKAKNDHIKDRQLPSKQTIFDKNNAQKIDSIISYLIKKFNTPLTYYYVPNWDNACYDPNDDHLYFGTTLLNDLYKTGGISAVTFFVCHEYAHFCQSRFPNGNSLVNGTVRINELQADFIASYLLGDIIAHNLIKYNEDTDILALAQAIYETGDNGFTDSTHHGTWAERTLTMFFPESTELGEQNPNDLKTIFGIVNKYYTKSGIIACGSTSATRIGVPLLGVGGLYNENGSGEECLIGIDFKLYPVRHKSYWGIEFNTKCTPIGEIEYTGKQVMNSRDEGLGFYIKMYPNIPYYPSKFFIYKKSVYKDESMKEVVPYLYWRTKTLND